MQVTHATLEDARAVAEIHVLSWQSAYKLILPVEYLTSLSVDKREAWWKQCIVAGTPQLLVAKTHGAVQGWLNFGACRDEDSTPSNAQVWALYVSPNSWSTGAGRALWLRARELMLAQGFKSCSLWVFPQNSRAITFYQAAGFHRDSSPTKSFELAGRQLEEVRYAINSSSEHLEGLPT